MGGRVGASLWALPGRGECRPRAWSASGTDFHTEGSLVNWSGVSFRATPIPYGVAMALPDVGSSIRHVVCQREALPRTRLREPQQFGPHVPVWPCFDK